MKRALAWILVVIMALSLLAGCAKQEAQAPAADSTPAADTAAEKPAESTSGTKKYRIALSNSYVGNDYRQEMEKIAEYIAASDKYKDVVELDIVNCDNSAEAQAASIDALIMEGYDAILVDAASATGINDAVERAAEAGIKVISFDQTVQSDKAVKLGLNFYDACKQTAEYVAAAIDYKGKVVVDRGLAGASKTSEMYQAALDVFAQYPDIEIVAEFDGNFTYSDTLSAMESIIAAQPQIDAVYTCGYADGAIDAFVDAGLKPVPTCGFYYNSSALAMLEHDVPALLILNPASLSATAMQMALDELNGVTTYQREELITPEYTLYSNYPDIADVGMPIEKLEEGVNCFKDMAGGFQLPVVDSSVGVEVPLELFK